MITDVVMGKNDISILENSILYFLGCAFIMYQPETAKSYRLVVIHNNRLLHDGNYKTLRGARIAFQKIFFNRAWRDDGSVRAEWSHFYDPDKQWLDDKLSISSTPLTVGH